METNNGAAKARSPADSTTYDVAPATRCQRMVYCTPEEAAPGAMRTGGVRAGQPDGLATTVKREGVDDVDGQPFVSASTYQSIVPLGTVASSRWAAGVVAKVAYAPSLFEIQSLYDAAPGTLFQLKLTGA